MACQSLRLLLLKICLEHTQTDTFMEVLMQVSTPVVFTVLVHKEKVVTDTIFAQILTLIMMST